MTHTILRLDTSARRTGSVSRDLTDRVVARLAASGAQVVTRDLADPLPLLDESWVIANTTPEDQRTAAQRERLALSDSLIAELKAADTLVIGLPIYNFGIPSTLKAWIDLVARAGVTFRYTPEGPQGLLDGKRAIIAVASGGTEVGSPIDFASTHLKQVLGFIGITDVHTVRADRLALDAEATIKAAQAAVEELPLVAA